jgi:hypothetical protein
MYNSGIHKYKKHRIEIAKIVSREVKDQLEEKKYFGDILISSAEDELSAHESFHSFVTFKSEEMGDLDS